ncbi:MAG: PEP-CTERM sorting domain-containing protein [Rhodocyclaceae bacterium]|nr:PEP-CTERM sorting domain-containing protein [Rhodocyclaceae bacterium]MCP5233773.1 PEP-CTERM sorting domain-containing protein [Zoogloeaceae bacterium]MCP5237764.1 PEP-CTERM sorting domain-containing protein [Zoogloeaceae bacterium]
MKKSRATQLLARTSLGIGLSIAALVANAALVTIDFESTVTFGGMDAAFGGSTIGQVIDGVYGTGTGTGGTAALTGSVTYDTNTVPYQQIASGNQHIANYLSPITAISLALWGTTFDADIGGVAAGTPAIVQTEVSGSVGCVGFLGCTGTLTSNVGFVGDDVPTQLGSPGGSVTFPDRDNFVLFFGGVENAAGTDVISAFNPYVVSTADGDLFIFLFGLAAVSNPDEDLWNSAGLPTDATFFDPDHLEVMNVQFFLYGLPAGGEAPVFALGVGSVSDYSVVTATDPTPPTNPVPEPGSALLVAAGLSALAARRLGRERTT